MPKKLPFYLGHVLCAVYMELPAPTQRSRGQRFQGEKEWGRGHDKENILRFFVSKKILSVSSK
jgi:hypothetical protein